MYGISYIYIYILIYCPSTWGFEDVPFSASHSPSWGNPSIFRKIFMTLGFPHAIPMAKYSKDHAITAFHCIPRISSIALGCFGGGDGFTMVCLIFNWCFLVVSHSPKTGPFVLQLPPCDDGHLHWVLGHVAQLFPWLVAQDGWHTEPASNATVLGRHGAVHEPQTVPHPNDNIKFMYIIYIYIPGGPYRCFVVTAFLKPQQVLIGHTLCSCLKLVWL